MAVIGFGLLALTAPASLDGQAGPEHVVLNGRTPEWLVATAVLAAPVALRDGAEVRAWTADERLVTLRDGSNTLICLADRPGDGEFGAACYHASLEPFMERGRELLREGVRGMERNEVRWREIETGEVRMPPMAMVYNISYGSEDIDPATFDPATAMRLHALYVPGASTETTGITTQPGDGPWLMFAGTPSAHLMVAMPPRESEAGGG